MREHPTAFSLNNAWLNLGCCRADKYQENSEVTQEWIQHERDKRVAEKRHAFAW